MCEYIILENFRMDKYIYNESDVRYKSYLHNIISSFG